MAVIDLNSDLGESFGAYTIGDDRAMIEIVSSANIACGFHGGDPLVMHRALALAREKGVAVGAHPSFLDLWGFGRRPILGDTPEEVGRFVLYQVGALQALAAAVGHRVGHVKLHGSLANLAQVDDALALGVARAIQALDRDLIFVVMPGLATERAGARVGLRMAREVYADRAYAEDGNLAPRKEPGAVIDDAGEATARVLRMLDEQAIRTREGRVLPVRIDSVSVHSDTPDAVALARRLRAALAARGVRIAPFGEFV